MTKNCILYSLISLFIMASISCKSAKTFDLNSNEKEQAQKYSDTVTIKSDVVEYEITIIEPGFNFWLNSTAQPKGFYGKNYLETRNRLMVQEWNLRVMQPQRFDPNLYELQINYYSDIDYGYDLNYQLYNYFIYFQIKYKQQLTAFIPRI